MHPLLPSAARLDALRPLAAQLISHAKDLPAQGMPQLRCLLRETLRPMNSFYTNKIEGQHTTPLLIVQAMNKDFSNQPDEARKQRVAIAHINTEKSAESHYPVFDALSFFKPEIVQAIHANLHAQLAPNDLVQLNAEEIGRAHV